MRKIVIIIFSLLIVFLSTSCNSCNMDNNTNKSYEQQKAIVDKQDKMKEDKMMLDLLAYESNENLKTLWNFNAMYYLETAEIGGQDIMSFNDDISGYTIYGNSKTKKIVYAVLRKNGYTGCEIGKNTIVDISRRFGDPIEKEKNIKYIYKTKNSTITFFFDEGGMLKNILINF